MAVLLEDVVALAEEILSPSSFKDYCPNGLQVEGTAKVKKIVAGVTACQALLDRAVESQADLLLVHHGFFWRGESEPLIGIKRKRIATLINNDLSLLAYHLPLDAHPEFGNNAQLAKLLGIDVQGGFDNKGDLSIGNVGCFKQPITPAALSQLLTEKLGREPQHISGGVELIKTIAWCTGAAEGMIDKALLAGADAYISGEISEPVVHIARESGIDYFAAGHHATECYGVQALGEFLARRLGLEYEFINIYNPV